MLCFKKFPVAKKFIDKTGGGGASIKICRRIFSSHTAEISVGESFTVALVSGIEKVWIRKRREYRYFLSKFFCLTVPKNFLGETFCAVFQKIPGIEKFYG